MRVDYVFIATILIYAMTVRALGAGKLNVIWSTVFAVLGPFLLKTITGYILFSASPNPLSLIFPVGSLIVVVIQLLVAVFVFSRIRKEEDSIGSYFGWSVAGLLLLFFIVPFVVQSIV